MTSERAAARARRTTDRVGHTLAEEILRLRTDAGLTRRALATAAGLDPGYLLRIEDGRARPSLDTYARLAGPLGADLVAHLYPTTGAAIHDRLQAPMLEALLELLHPRWNVVPEVAVRHPARGWIDALLHESQDKCVVATEIQSGLPRLEQLVRWHAEKLAALPSWEGYAHLGSIRTTSKLLVVRSTRTTRSIGREFERQLEAAYPAHPDDILRALSGSRPWPGAGLLWVELGKAGARFLRRR